MKPRLLNILPKCIRPTGATGNPLHQGRQAILLAALLIGILLMGIQLWLLTVALELYLGGHGAEIWLLSLASGAIFVGGLLVLRILDMRRPRVG